MDIPIIKTKNLVKLYLKGRIDKLYRKMFDEARKIANIETQDYISKLQIEDIEDFTIDGSIESDNDFKILKLMYKYRNERIDYHMKQMYKLLLKHLKEQK